MFWNKQRVFTRGVVKSRGWVSSGGDRMSFVVDAVVSLEHFEGMSANLQWKQIFFNSSEPAAASSSLTSKSPSFPLYFLHQYPRRLTVPFNTMTSETHVSVQPSHQHLEQKTPWKLFQVLWHLNEFRKGCSRLRGTFQILFPHLEIRTKLWVCPCKGWYVYTAILCVLCCASKWEING